jgi:PAS domain-containing protein
LSLYFAFPEWLPRCGLVSDVAVFGLVTFTLNAFSGSKLRSEARGRMVEEQLRTSERRLTLSQSAARLGVWDRDLRTNEIAICGECAGLYGLPPNHPLLTYEEWLKLIHPLDREGVQELLREAVERRHVWDTEFRVVWPDGSVHWILTKGTVFLDDTGRPVRSAGVNLDITDRKQAQAALRESDLQYKEVFSNISVCMFLLDVTPGRTFQAHEFQSRRRESRGPI